MRGIHPLSRSIVFAVFFFLIALASALIIKPFFSIIVVSGILAYLCYPLYKLLLKHIKSPTASAGLVILLLVIILLVPLFLLVVKLTSESVDAYRDAKGYFEADGFSSYCEIPRLGCGAYESIEPLAEKYDFDLGSGIESAVFAALSFAVRYISGLALEIPLFALLFFFTMFLTYYFLKEGKDWLQQIKNRLPLSMGVKRSIITKFSNVMHATIYGAIVLSIIQGVIAIIGYWLLGVPAPILFGLITMIATFIPFIGGAIIWIPISFWMIFQGISTGYTVMVFQGLGVFAFGLAIVSTIDNILKPKIVGHKADMHPLLILLGVFGGMAVFGVMGIVVGPVVLALFITSLEIYEKENMGWR